MICTASFSGVEIMPSNKKMRAKTTKIHEFESLSEFDRAMKQIASIPKKEMGKDKPKGTRKKRRKK